MRRGSVLHQTMVPITPVWVRICVLKGRCCFSHSVDLFFFRIKSTAINKRQNNREKYISKIVKIYLSSRVALHDNRSIVFDYECHVWGDFFSSARRRRRRRFSLSLVPLLTRKVICVHTYPKSNKSERLRETFEALDELNSIYAHFKRTAGANTVLSQHRIQSSPSFQYRKKSVLHPHRSEIWAQNNRSVENARAATRFEIVLCNKIINCISNVAAYFWWLPLCVCVFFLSHFFSV